MQAYQERVVIELAALSEKIANLVIFMGSKQYKALPLQEMKRLRVQQHAMMIYESVLQDRINAFDYKKETP